MGYLLEIARICHPAARALHALHAHRSAEGNTGRWPQLRGWPTAVALGRARYRPPPVLRGTGFANTTQAGNLGPRQRSSAWLVGERLEPLGLGQADAQPPPHPS